MYTTASICLLHDPIEMMRVKKLAAFTVVRHVAANPSAATQPNWLGFLILPV